MKNIIDYVKTFGHLSFIEKAFNNVDICVFASLVYIQFEDVAPKFTEPEKPPLYLRDCKEYSFKSNCIDGKRHLRLLKLLCDSKRYKDVSIQYVFEVFDKVYIEQFCAMTFNIPDIGYLVAFRGTDNTLEGWVEDIGTGLESATAGQLDSTEYLLRINKFLNGKHFMICGHSKGGNLAVFSSIYSRKDVYQNIDKVYSLDGNGLGNDRYLKLPSYKYLKDKIYSIVPKDSVVGQLLYVVKEPVIVKALGFFVFQHSTYMWKVNLKTGDFEYTDKLSFSSRVRHRAIQNWYLNRDDDQKLIILYLIFYKDIGSKNSVLKTIRKNKKTLIKEERKQLKGLFSSYLRAKNEAFFYYLRKKGNY